jgi:hypothetical protein
MVSFNSNQSPKKTSSKRNQELNAAITDQLQSSSRKITATGFSRRENLIIASGLPSSSWAYCSETFSVRTYQANKFLRCPLRAKVLHSAELSPKELAKLPLNETYLANRFSDFQNKTIY